MHDKPIQSCVRQNYGEVGSSRTKFDRGGKLRNCVGEPSNAIGKHVDDLRGEEFSSRGVKNPTHSCLSKSLVPPTDSSDGKKFQRLFFGDQYPPHIVPPDWEQPSAHQHRNEQIRAREERAKGDGVLAAGQRISERLGKRVFDRATDTGSATSEGKINNRQGADIFGTRGGKNHDNDDNMISKRFDSEIMNSNIPTNNKARPAYRKTGIDGGDALVGDPTGLQGGVRKVKRSQADTFVLTHDHPPIVSEKKLVHRDIPMS